MKGTEKANEIRTFLELHKEFKDVTVLLIDHFDSGIKSPFNITRVQFYLLKPAQASFEFVSEGVSYYNDQIDTWFLGIFLLLLLSFSYILPKVL
jgi:hypothetical protein